MNSRVWTQTITNGTITISESFGLIVASIVLTSGTATITGDLTVGGMASQAVPMVIGLPVNMVSKSNNALSGITIDASAGTIDIVGQQ